MMEWKKLAVIAALVLVAISGAQGSGVLESLSKGSGPLKFKLGSSGEPEAPEFPPQFSGWMRIKFRFPIGADEVLEQEWMGKVYYDYTQRKERVDMTTPDGTISAVQQWDAEGENGSEDFFSNANGELTCGSMSYPFPMPTPSMLQDAVFEGVSILEGHGFVNAWAIDYMGIETTFFTSAVGETWKILYCFNEYMVMEYFDLEVGGISSTTFTLPQQCYDGTLPFTRYPPLLKTFGQAFGVAQD